MKTIESGAGKKASAALAAFALAVLGSAPARGQLPPSPEPPENPSTPEKEVLGKILFWEEQLSADNTMACGTCHIPEFGGSDPRITTLPGPDNLPGTPDDIFGSAGVRLSNPANSFIAHPTLGSGVQVTPRFSPSFMVAQYGTTAFWDGRATSQFIDPQTLNVSIVSGGALESQAVGPPVSSSEMAHLNRTWTQITGKLAIATPMQLATNLPPDVSAALVVNPTYPDLFQAAFGDPAITAERIAFAIAAYERSLLPDEAPIDLYNQGDVNALTPQQVAGFNIFNSTNCLICHPAPFFSDFNFHNIGVRPSTEDLGRFAISGLAGDEGRFKTATIRNAKLRKRFMHSGSIATLREVIEFYNRGGDFFDNLDPLMQPLNLTATELDQLTDFIENAFVDPRVAAGLPPFDRPTLYSERVPANPLVYGSSNLGSGGFEPLMLISTTPNLGNLDFRLGLGQALGGTLAGLIFGVAPDSLVVNGVPINVDFSFLLWHFHVTNGAGAGAGYATQHYGLPVEPILVDLNIFAQWFVLDSAAPNNLAATRGADITMFQ